VTHLMRIPSATALPAPGSHKAMQQGTPRSCDKCPQLHQPCPTKAALPASGSLEKPAAMRACGGIPTQRRRSRHQRRTIPGQGGSRPAPARAVGKWGSGILASGDGSGDAAGPAAQGPGVAQALKQRPSWPHSEVPNRHEPPLSSRSRYNSCPAVACPSQPQGAPFPTRIGPVPEGCWRSPSPETACTALQTHPLRRSSAPQHNLGQPI
jgi:hypothetical protein